MRGSYCLIGLPPEETKQILLDIIEEVYSEHKDWTDFEVDKDLGNDWLVSFCCHSKVAGEFVITANISQYYVELSLTPAKYHFSEFWDDPKSYVYLNKANDQIDNHCKMVVVDFNIIGTPTKSLRVSRSEVEVTDFDVTKPALRQSINGLIRNAEHGVRVLQTEAKKQSKA